MDAWRVLPPLPGGCLKRPEIFGGDPAGMHLRREETGDVLIGVVLNYIGCKMTGK